MKKIIIYTLIIIGSLLLIIFIMACALYSLSNDCPPEICDNNHVIEGVLPWSIRHVKEIINPEALSKKKEREKTDANYKLVNDAISLMSLSGDLIVDDSNTISQFPLRLNELDKETGKPIEVPTLLHIEKITDNNDILASYVVKINDKKIITFALIHLAYNGYNWNECEKRELKKFINERLSGRDIFLDRGGLSANDATNSSYGIKEIYGSDIYYFKDEGKSAISLFDDMVVNGYIINQYDKDENLKKIMELAKLEGKGLWSLCK